MSLTRYEPWGLLNQFSRELNRMMDPELVSRTGDEVNASDWAPAVDIKEETDRFIIRADVPGVDPKDIDINMENGVMTISGQRETESKEERDGYKRVERVRGTFMRRFNLPDTANAEKITAKANNGVLEIVIPKQDEVKPRRISVQS